MYQGAPTYQTDSDPQNIQAPQVYSSLPEQQPHRANPVGYYFDSFYKDHYDASTNESRHSLADVVDRVDTVTRDWARLFFLVFKLILIPFINLYLEFLSLLLFIFKKLFVDVLPVVVDNIYKPVWHMIYTFIFLPLLTLWHNICEQVLRMDAAIKLFNLIVDAFVRVFNSIRLIQINYFPGKPEPGYYRAYNNEAPATDGKPTQGFGDGASNLEEVVFVDSKLQVKTA